MLSDFQKFNCIIEAIVCVFYIFKRPASSMAKELNLPEDSCVGTSLPFDSFEWPQN
jgi:hypothetical protein